LTISFIGTFFESGEQEISMKKLARLIVKKNIDFMIFDDLMIYNSV